MARPPACRRIWRASRKPPAITHAAPRPRRRNGLTPRTGSSFAPGAGAGVLMTQTVNGPSGPLPPDSQVVGLYLAACASATPLPVGKPVSVRTLERRLSAIAWFYAQRRIPLNRADRHIAEVMKGIRRRHGRPPDHKEAGAARCRSALPYLASRSAHRLRCRCSSPFWCLRTMHRPGRRPTLFLSKLGRRGNSDMAANLFIWLPTMSVANCSPRFSQWRIDLTYHRKGICD
jgi:hypothetical protein